MINRYIANIFYLEISNILIQKRNYIIWFLKKLIKNEVPYLKKNRDKHQAN